MPEAPASFPFVMHGARAAIASGMLHIEEQVTAIEQALIERPALAFDLSKTLIESACRTILRERSIPFDPGDDLLKLFKTVRNALPFLPASTSAATKVRKSLTQTLSGLHTTVQGICELRNLCGFASHGAEGPRPRMETVQALLAAEAADAIVGFLDRIHREDRLFPPSVRADYDDNPEFNDYVDETHGVISIFEAEFSPSDILFELEPETYRVYLAEFRAGKEGGKSEPESSGKERTGK